MRDVSHDPLSLQLRRQPGKLVQHDASDAFPAQLFGNDEVDKVNSSGLELHLEHGHQIAGELSEQARARFGRATELRGIPMGSLAVPVAAGRKPLLAEFEEWFRGWLPESRRAAENAMVGNG